jgi:hypothetical protein
MILGPSLGYFQPLSDQFPLLFAPDADRDTSPAEDEKETSPNHAPPLTPALGNRSMRCSSCGVHAVASPRGQGDRERLRRVFAR